MTQKRETHSRWEKRYIGLRKILIAAAVLIVAAMTLGGGLRVPAVQAATNEGYDTVQEIFTDEKGVTIAAGKAVKKGNYYFKYKIVKDENNQEKKVYYISKYKNKGFQKIKTVMSEMCTNGKMAYFTKGKNLYKCNLKTMKSKKIGTIPIEKHEKNDGENLVMDVYGNIILLNRNDWLGPNNIAVYNMKTKKIKYICPSGAYKTGNGKYFVTADDTYGDMVFLSISLWKYTSTGVKKVKTLAKYSGTGDFPASAFATEKYIYYINYKDNGGGSFNVYRCKLNGDGKKKLALVKINGYGCLTKITATYCEYVKWSTEQYYRYTYATKKTKKIKTPDYF